MKRVKMSWLVALGFTGGYGLERTRKRGGNHLSRRHRHERRHQGRPGPHGGQRDHPGGCIQFDGFSHRKYKKANYELEKAALAAGSSRMPDIGYNIGIYNFSPSWKEIYPVQKFDRSQGCRGHETAAGQTVRDERRWRQASTSWKAC